MSSREAHNTLCSSSVPLSSIHVPNSLDTLGYWLHAHAMWNVREMSVCFQAVASATLIVVYWQAHAKVAVMHFSTFVLSCIMKKTQQQPETKLWQRSNNGCSPVNDLVVRRTARVGCGDGAHAQPAAERRSGVWERPGSLRGVRLSQRQTGAVRGEGHLHLQRETGLLDPGLSWHAKWRRRASGVASITPINIWYITAFILGTINHLGLWLRDDKKKWFWCKHLWGCTKSKWLTPAMEMFQRCIFFFFVFYSVMAGHTGAAEQLISYAICFVVQYIRSAHVKGLDWFI